MSVRASISAIAYALPSRVVSNEDLARENPVWDMARLLERTGVAERRIAGQDETALDLGYRAAQTLDAEGTLRPAEIDALIFCTETPDYILPPNSSLLHGRLGLRNDVMAFDITLACSGFVYAIGLGRSLILSGTVKRVLIVTADTYSRLIHPADRASRCLFGDGGAATVMSAEDPGLEVVDVTFGTCGAQHERFILRGGGARMPSSPETRQEVTDRSGNIRTAEHVAMDGLGVLSFFNSTVPRAVNEILSRNRLTLDDIGCFIPHQASRVAVEGIARALRLTTDRYFLDMEDIGNLVSASIPVALRRASEADRLRHGQWGLLCGFGVGLSWATAIIKA